jgi:hypothetical protein
MKTPTLLPLARLCGALAVTALFSACSGAANAPMQAAPAVSGPAPVSAAAPATPAAAGGLLQQLQAEIGDAACDSSAQCKTVAVGHKACGGPERYLAWSSKRSDAAKVASLAERYMAERKAQDVKSGMMSTCSLVVDPGAACNAGRCVAGQGGLSAPAVR